MSFIPFLQVSGAASPSSSQGFMMTILPFALIILIFYFFIIRPQNKKQKETEKMISALKKGDKIVTIGGVHGVISLTKEKTVVVKVDDNTKLEINRSAIANVESTTTKSTVSKSKKVEKNLSETEKNTEKTEEKLPVDENSSTAEKKE